MKRVLAFASALALAVGAIAPAAFASDNVPAQIPITDIYADPVLYDLYVAPYYNNLSFEDWGDYATDAVISGFPMNTVKQIETTEGGLESLWNTVHDAFTFGYNIGQDWVSKLYVDTSDGRLKSDGNIMTDDLKALLNQYFKTYQSGGAGIVHTVNGDFYYLPAGSFVQTNSIDGFRGGIRNYSSVDVYAFRYAADGGAAGLQFCSYQSGGGAQTGTYIGGTFYPSQGYSLSYAYSNLGYYSPDYWSSDNNSRYALSGVTVFSSSSAGRQAFFGAMPSAPESGYIWNGDGYYRDEYNVDIALPAIPAIDWKDLNDKYYIEYGDEFVEGDVNNFYYDISYNYFPAEYTYTIPYWLIDGNTSILDFDYSLELPTVDLYELPSEFDGGEEVWDSSFTMLGGFGAFILLGFSFGLVSLFFKD